jgi:predicted transcriptional regulator
MSLQVKNYMSTEIIYISPDINGLDAMKKLLELKMSGLPVIDDKGNLCGVFTEKEVLKSILPAYVKDVGAFIYSDVSKAELKKIAELEKFSVRDLMRKDVVTIGEDASLTEASRLMLTKSERRLVVLRQGKAAGIITRADVVGALAKEAGVIS